MKKRFAVYCNQTRKLFIEPATQTATIPATLKAAKAWIAVNLRHTHMGEWVRSSNGYHYMTSIGLYYAFVRETEPNEERKVYRNVGSNGANEYDSYAVGEDGTYL